MAPNPTADWIQLNVSVKDSAYIGTFTDHVFTFLLRLLDIGPLLQVKEKKDETPFILLNVLLTQ
jgi:hypothetical protein